MVPLGPFNGKSVGTSISPWIVVPDALRPFQTMGQTQGGVPPYLHDPVRGTFKVKLQAEVITGGSATTVGTCYLQDMYWTMRQIVAHGVSSGAALRTGDVFASGTVSGPGEGALGCLLEVTEGGKNPVKLGDGSTRAFLEDGDIVRFTAVAGEDDSGVGFGECVGQLVSARGRE